VTARWRQRRAAKRARRYLHAEATAKGHAFTWSAPLHVRPNSNDEFGYIGRCRRCGIGRGVWGAEDEVALPRCGEVRRAAVRVMFG
jgi:hypothetical protein